MEEERQTEVKNKEPVLLLPAKKEKKKKMESIEKKIRKEEIKILFDATADEE